MATTRTRSTSTAKRAPARRRSPSRADSGSNASVASDVKKVARSARTRVTRAAKAIPTDTRSLTIAGIIAGAIGAGIALFLNRDRVRSAAATGGEKIKKVADDLSTMAHERLDQARDNITKFRSRNAPPATENEANQAPFAAIG